MNTITINNYKDILDQLDAEVCAPNSNPTVQKVIREIKEKIEEIRSSGDALIKENDILKIGVVGQVKAGKSSFLNSLFFDGENVLPRASTPMTAGLTVLEYGEEDVFTVEYYNSKEWEVFKDRAKQYDRIIQENRAAFPSMSDDEIARSIGIQDELASAKELVTKCGRNASDEIQPVSKVVSKAFGSIAGLQEVLSDYVGADGRYTSIVKCLTIKLNDERLKGMRIVDTPGVNDPVISREQRTREFLRECHGVFFLSFASRFFDSTDVTFLSSRIGEQGIGTVVLIASKFDSVLQDVGMKFKDDLGTAMDDCQRNLKKQYRNNIASSDYKGDDPIFDVSSGIGFSIYKKPKERWDDIERHVVKQMQTFYPSFFGNDSDIKDTFFNLSQMDKMRDDYLEGIFKKNKDKIIAGKMSAYFSNATSNLKKCVTDKLSELQEMMLALESSDISDMRTKKRLLEDVTTKIKDEISSIVSRLDSRAELYYKESLNTFRIDSISNIPTENQEAKVTRKGTFWGGDKSFCITYQGVAVHKLIEDTMKAFDRSMNNLSSVWSRKLSELNEMMKNEMLQIIEDSEQNDKTGKLDADALRRILNNTIEDMQSKGTLEIATQREKLKSSLQSDLQGIEDIKTSFDNKISEEQAKAEIIDAATKSKKEAAYAVNDSLSAISQDIAKLLKKAREDALSVLKENRGVFMSMVEESTMEYITTLEKNLTDKESQLRYLKEGLINISNIKEKLS